MTGAGIVIVGGGLAAQRCCETLRSRGHDGPIRIVSDEPIPPYDRPPLSKELLLGEIADQELGFRPLAWYEEAEVELLLDERASGSIQSGARSCSAAVARARLRASADRHR